MDNISILTWNIGGGIIDGRKDLDYFINELKDLNADVMCLQEINYPINSSKGADDTKIICRELGFKNYHTQPYNTSHIDKDYWLSLSILSRFPIKQSIYFPLSNPMLSKDYESGEKIVSHNKGFLKSTIDLNSGIDVWSIHSHALFPFGKDILDEDMQKYISEIRDIVLGQSGSSSIIAGDFNTDSLDDVFQGIGEHNLRSVLPQLPTTKHGLKLSYILVPNTYDIRAAEVLKTKTSHYILKADLKIK